MNIAVVTASISRDAGGIFEIVRRLTQTLQVSEGLRVQVLGLQDSCTAKDLSAWGQVPVKAYPVLGPRSFGYSPALGRALRQCGVDLVHGHGLWMYPSCATRAWSRHSGRPHLVTIHGMLDPWALRNGRWRKRLAAWLYENRHLRSAALLHVNTMNEARVLRQYGLRNPICIIPNGIDLPEKPGAKNHRALDDPEPRSQRPPSGISGPNDTSSLPSDRKVLLYLGRLHPKKGLPNLLRAWAQVATHGPKGADEWCLAIAGWDQNGHEAQLRTQVKEMDLARSVRFLGPRFDAAKAAVLAQADSLVLPSFSEGLPMAVLEAWSYGLPVVMTPQCNLPEGYRAGAALHADPEERDLARALTELFEMGKSDRRAMGERGRRLASEKFAWSNVAGQMKAVYEWTLGGGDPPACVRLD